MKILCYKNQIDYEEIESEVKYFTNGYIEILVKDTENGQYAVYTSDNSLRRVDFEYSSTKDLYDLKIVEIPLDEETIDFRIISARNLNDLRITQRQIELLINATQYYLDSLDKMNGNTAQDKFRIKFEKEKTEEVKLLLESVINYNLKEACEMCERKRNRKENLFGLGEGAFEQSARLNLNR